MWRGRPEELIGEGVARGEFHTRDPYAATIQILVVIDGLGAHANTDTSDRPAVVTRMAVTTAERELGLAIGTLTHGPGAGRLRRRPARPGRVPGHLVPDRPVPHASALVERNAGSATRMLFAGVPR
ncbi:hypothetical protein [Streptomyces sp. NPDC014734]|uniref:hypothetical protein n=1 Tax=Streptomyces sp. NPDC014734 TaxID=3364886 RepID=UPI0036FD8E4B